MNAVRQLGCLPPVLAGLGWLVFALWAWEQVRGWMPW